MNEKRYLDISQKAISPKLNSQNYANFSVKHSFGDAKWLLVKRNQKYTYIDKGFVRFSIHLTFFIFFVVSLRFY